MKISIQAIELKVAVTTDGGEEIYTYNAGQTSTIVDVLALLGSAGELTTAVIGAIEAAKSAKQQD